MSALLAPQSTSGEGLDLQLRRGHAPALPGAALHTKAPSSPPASGSPPTPSWSSGRRRSIPSATNSPTS
jgi:hypothetical protein